MATPPLPQDFISIVKDIDQRLRRVEKRIAIGPLVLPSDTAIYFDGTDKTTYIMWNSGTAQLEFYIAGVLEGFISATNTGTRLANV